MTCRYIAEILVSDRRVALSIFLSEKIYSKNITFVPIRHFSYHKALEMILFNMFVRVCGGSGDIACDRREISLLSFVVFCSEAFTVDKEWFVTLINNKLHFKLKVPFPNDFVGWKRNLFFFLIFRLILSDMQWMLRDKRNLH